MENSAIRLKMLLDETGMKQQELVEKTGIDKSKISKYLKGEYCPKADAAYKIALVFHVSPVWIMGVEGIDRYDNPINQQNTKDYSQSDIERALQFIDKYDKLVPQVQEAVRSLLESGQSNP